MNLVPTAITKQVFRGGLQLKKNAPNLMFGAGIIGVIGSTVMACKATLTLAEELPAMQEELADIRHEQLTNPEDHRRNVTYVYGKNAARVARLYAPSVLVGTVAIGALTGSHVTLNKRNAGLTAAYAAVNKAYDEYRERVREDIGEDREMDLYRGNEKKEITNDAGKPDVVTVNNVGKHSPYARLFEESNRNWVKNAELNRMFILVQQEHLQLQLQTRGHVFLNDAYDALGMERSREGAVVGWVLDGDGDNYIDFGLDKEENIDFALGRERCVWLDFNVDGVVFDRI